jgi:hypothetical protein
MKRPKAHEVRGHYHWYRSRHGVQLEGKPGFWIRRWLDAYGTIDHAALDRQHKRNTREMKFYRWERLAKEGRLNEAGKRQLEALRRERD